jgi:putative nucleotidyltransferase with HDIG domain
MIKARLIPVLRVVILYAAFSIIWILVSDQILVWLVKNPYTLTLLQTYKGGFFVLSSAALLYLLLAKELRLREQAWEAYDHERNRMLSELSKAHEQSSRRAEQLTTINRFGQQMAETYDLSEIYNCLVEAIHALMDDITAVCLSLYNSEKQWITCTYTLTNGKKVVSSDPSPISLDSPGYELPRIALLEQRPMVMHAVPTLPAHLYLDPEAQTPQSVAYVPMLSRNTVVGLLQVQSRRPNRFAKAELDLLTIITNTAGIAIQNATLIEQLQRSNKDLSEAYDATIEGWSRALELRDEETEGHTQRVAALTLKLARRMGFSSDELVHIRRGALLHDIGKMGVPDSILHKAGPLSDEERAIIQAHPTNAYRMLSPIEYLKPALDIPFAHHERWDGAGYPRGLKGEEIPLPARIFAVVDVWDALTSERPYHPAWQTERAFTYLRKNAGSQFDPTVVDTFIDLMNGQHESATVRSPSPSGLDQ